MALAIPAMMAAGAVVSAIGTLRGGREDAAMLRRQAEVTRQQAQADEEAQRRESRQLLGAQAAAMAESGGGLDEGVMRQSAVLAELDALNIRYGGRMRAEGLLAQAKSVKRQSKYLAGSQLLTGVSSAYTAHRQIGP